MKTEELIKKLKNYKNPQTTYYILNSTIDEIIEKLEELASMKEAAKEG